MKWSWFRLCAIKPEPKSQSAWHPECFKDELGQQDYDAESLADEARQLARQLRGMQALRLSLPGGIMTTDELIERVMTEHWDIGACPCTFCEEARKLGFRPRGCYPTNPKVSILDDGSKEHKRPVYDFALVVYSRPQP